MQKSSTKRRIVSSAPAAAIVFNQGSSTPEQDRSGPLLVVFMRAVAILWMVEGLVQWGLVVLTDVDGRSGLVMLSTPAIVAVVFFAVINLIASVGLWLATPWGGVIWLVTAGAQLFIVITMPGFFTYPIAMAALDVCLVAAYLVLTWKAAGAQGRLSRG